MLQGQITWEYRHIIREPSTSFKLYVFFLLLVCIVAVVKLLRAWRGAPPFRLSAKEESPTYVQELHASASSLRQWIGLTFLGWGIFTSISLVDVCYRALSEKVLGWATFLFVLTDYAHALNMALFAVLLLYLIRWHMLTRIDRLEKQTSS